MLTLNPEPFNPEPFILRSDIVAKEETLNLVFITR
jgi:hypothetical protein